MVKGISASRLEKWHKNSLNKLIKYGKNKSNMPSKIATDPIVSDMGGYGKALVNMHKVLNESPKNLLNPKSAQNVKGLGISFNQGSNQPNYSATKIVWKHNVKETIAANNKNGIGLELVPNDGKPFLGIKDIWSDGYHRIDRDSVVIHYGNYAPTRENHVAANPQWVKSHLNPDGTVKDRAFVANDKGARIFSKSYVTANGKKIRVGKMKPGTKVHKDQNAVVNAVAYDKEKTFKTLEGNIKTNVTMGDVEGNVYNNFKKLKNQITADQLVANKNDVNSAKFVELVKAGKDDEAINLLIMATKQTELQKAGKFAEAEALSKQIEEFKKTV